MRQLLRRCCESKRECITYIVILLWIVLGIHSTINEVDLIDVAAYFVSLTGFVGSYIYGESMRSSTESSIFLKGRNSKREALTYFIILLWAIIGFSVIYYKKDILGASAYFAALTPFVGAFILGETHKEENPYIDPYADPYADSYADTQTEEQINS